MADLKVWAISLCVAAVAGGVMNLLIPNTSLEKIMKLVIAAFFLSCIISPVILHFPEIHLTLAQDAKEEMQQVQNSLTTTVDEQVSGAVSVKVDALLKEIGVGAENISIRYNTADNASISISQIDIVLPPGFISREAEIREYISQKTGNRVNITFAQLSDT